MTVVNRQYYILNGKLISYRGKDKRIEIPEEVNDIAPRAFFGSIATEAIISGNVSNIETMAFAETKLKKLFILDGVKSLEASSFANCRALEEVYLLSSSLLPFSKASSVFSGCTAVNTLYLDKISTKLLMFLDDAFPSLRDIYIDSDNTLSFVEKLKEKFPKATVHVKGVYDKNVSNLTSSLIKQIEALFALLPDGFRDRLSDDFRSKYAEVKEEELLHNSAVVTEKLQRIIMNFDETKKFIPFMELINRAKRALDKELFLVPMVRDDDVISKISYIHYVAMKFNDLSLSKNIDAVLDKIQERISNYVLDGDNLSTLELINILNGYLNGKVDTMYEQVRTKYNNPSIGKYVDLLDEFREEKKSGLFYYFNGFLRDGVNDNLNNSDKLDNYNRSYQRCLSYEKFVTDEINKILNRVSPRYPSYEEMENDLVKDFRNRDSNFTDFYKQYKANEKVRPYLVILNSLSFYGNEKMDNNFGYEVDNNLISSLDMVNSLISSLKDSERVFYQNELKQFIARYIDKLNKKIEEVSKSNESSQKYLYNLQVEAMGIKDSFEDGLSKLVSDIHTAILRPQDTMLVDKSIDLSLAILDSSKEVKVGNSRIALLVSRIVEELVAVDQETASSVLAKLKESLMVASVAIRENKEAIIKGKEGSINKILENYVYNIVNEYYQFVLKYKGKYIELQNFRNDFEMKKAC